jgi:malate dehydrogenase (oxaloacetate-decarboxylating)(NADP+)
LKGLQHHKLAFAHDVHFVPNLLEAVQHFKPTALLGVSTIPSAFNQKVIEAMAEINKRPIIFPLSNPTHKSECTYAEAVQWTGGKVLFASGSPFDSLNWQGKDLTPAQANNAYVFPALGHAAVLAKSRKLPQEVFLMTAEALSKLSSIEQLQQGHLFPPFSEIIPTSKKIIIQLCEYFEESGLGSRPAGSSWEEVVEEAMWTPSQAMLKSRM